MLIRILSVDFKCVVIIIFKNSFHNSSINEAVKAFASLQQPRRSTMGSNSAQDNYLCDPKIIAQSLDNVADIGRIANIDRRQKKHESLFVIVKTA